MSGTEGIDFVIAIVIIFGGGFTLIFITNIIGTINADCVTLGTITSIESENVVTLDNGKQYVMSSSQLLETGLPVEECSFNSLIGKESFRRLKW